MFAAPEAVTVVRDGATVDVLQGAYDPLEGRVYLPYGADVLSGDTISVRGLTRTTSADRQDWHNPFTNREAGSVVILDAAPASLPDLGQLLRGGGSPVLDETTGELTPTAGTQVWSGACLVEPAQSDGSNPEIGDQQVGIVPFTVTIPLAVTDVRPGDLFKVTSSRDQRLLTRTLVVKAIRASSTALTRTLLAFDNQGGA